MPLQSTFQKTFLKKGVQAIEKNKETIILEKNDNKYKGF